MSTETNANEMSGVRRVQAVTGVLFALAACGAIAWLWWGPYRGQAGFADEAPMSRLVDLYLLGMSEEFGSEAGDPGNPDLRRAGSLVARYRLLAAGDRGVEAVGKRLDDLGRCEGGRRTHADGRVVAACGPA